MLLDPNAKATLYGGRLQRRHDPDAAPCWCFACVAERERQSREAYDLLVDAEDAGEDVLVGILQLALEGRRFAREGGR